MPISTTCSPPAKSLPGETSKPVLRQPKVTVRSAATAISAISPVSAATPLGISTATTKAPLALMSSTTAAAAGRRTPEPPIPTIPSMMTSASKNKFCRDKSLSASCHCTTLPFARSSAATPASWALAATHTAVTETPRCANFAPAKSASPPLLPPPTAIATWAPRTRPRDS